MKNTTLKIRKSQTFMQTFMYGKLYFGEDYVTTLFFDEYTQMEDGTYALLVARKPIIYIDNIMEDE